MKIPSVVYQIFYEVLCQSVVDKFHKGKKRKYKSIKSRQIWTDIDESDYIRLFGGDVSTNAEYFYRKRIELNPQKTLAGEIDDRSMFKALDYIGIDPPPSKDLNKVGINSKAKILLEQFEQKYKKEIAKLANEHSGEHENDETDQDFLRVTDVIQNYWKSIQEKNPELAWDLLSPEYKERTYQGNLDLFLNFYKKSRFYFYLDIILVLGHEKLDPKKIKCYALLKYQFPHYISTIQSKLSVLTIEDLDEFCEVVKKTRDDFKSKGYKGFEKVEIKRLFELDTNFILHQVPFNPINGNLPLADFFEPSNISLGTKLFEFSLVLLDRGKWHIDKCEVTSDKPSFLY